MTCSLDATRKMESEDRVEEKMEAEDALDSLVRMCSEEECNAVRCLQTRAKVKELEALCDSSLDVDGLESRPARNLFRLIFEHSRVPCDEMNCSVPLCLYISHIRKSRFVEDDPDSVLLWMRNENRHAALGQFSNLVNHKRFIFMDSSIEWTSGKVETTCDLLPPSSEANKFALKYWKREWLDLDVEHISSDGRPLFVDETSTFYVPRLGFDFAVEFEYLSGGLYGGVARSRMTGFHFLMKMQQSFFLSREDYEEQFMRDIKRLKDCSHENLSRMLWVSMSHDKRLLCGHLHECSDMAVVPQMSKQWSSSAICRFACGLVRGAKFLQDACSLYFLNWRVSALLCNSQTMVGKLWEFTFIFPVGEGDDDDLHQIVESLDCSSTPIELLECKIGSFTEVYGIAAVMLQVASGRNLLHDYRHHTREEKMEAVKQLWSSSYNASFQMLMESHFRDPEICRHRKPIIEILEASLGPQRQRISLDDLEGRLLNVINTHT